MKREPNDKEYLYRYEDQSFGRGVDMGGESITTGPPNVQVILMSFPIVRRTPKGAWIDLYEDFIWPWRDKDRHKFVLLTARKRFACPTLDEAMESFIQRKNVQLSKLRAQQRRAEIALDKAQKGEILEYNL